MSNERVFNTKKGNRRWEKREDPFPGPAPVLEEKKKVYKRGEKYNKSIRDIKLKSQLDRTENKYDNADTQATRYELLLTDDPGFLETEEGEKSWKIRQHEIVESVDITSASKHFELNLNQFGPYSIDYTRNGRHLLLGGKRGHVAAFDWMTKKLMCEMNVMESVNDVRWLHTENMFAVAQKRWVYVYDNQGIEIHCLKQFNETCKLDFLPFHFLLVAANRHGFLQYLDISVGKIVSTIRTKCGRLDVMCQNPHNATIVLGHHNGTVTMWSPSQKEPLVKMLCHKSAVRAVAVDAQGNYLATSGQDRRMKIYDIRTFKPLHCYTPRTAPSNLEFSQRGLLAATRETVVEIYKDPCLQVQERPYLTHHLKYAAKDIKFCPYEDVLGVGKTDGFISLLVPGAGEPNFDANEANPLRSKKQRKEWEVAALLEKIQPDMISLDPLQLAKVDHVTAGQLQKDRIERLGYIPVQPKFEPRFKKKGRSKSGHVEKRKQKMAGEALRAKVRESLNEKRIKLEEENKEQTKASEEGNVETFGVARASGNEDSNSIEDISVHVVKNEDKLIISEPDSRPMNHRPKSALDRFRKKKIS